ncbi:MULTISPECIES: hypothetical protein, partial [unclassified Roseobacter]|uniref:hypothetical protein n=1 Tax=unclassified Roseobacter TaxID=196798 RepID=UPI001C0EDCEF
ADAPMRRCADAPMRRCADAPMVRPLNSSRKQKTELSADIIGAFCIANSGRLSISRADTRQVQKRPFKTKSFFHPKFEASPFMKKLPPPSTERGSAECVVDQSCAAIHPGDAC